MDKNKNKNIIFFIILPPILKDYNVILNDILMISIEIEKNFEIFLKVGARGLEPPTLGSQDRCATKLRYAPNEQFLYYNILQLSMINFIILIVCL